jgi:AhpD family alkylhydroperoxidase
MITMAVVGALALLPPEAWTQAPQQRRSPEAEATYREMKTMLGLTPTFFRMFPEEAIGPAWEEMKALQLSTETALPPKIKELVGLAVAAQIPCRYCVYFHTQVAKAHGATDREIKESIAIAAGTRHWSTVLNGQPVDDAAFRSEVSKILSYLRKNAGARGRAPATTQITDAKSAYKDMERTLGMVPSFLRAFPQEGIAPAWRMLKSLEMNPNTAIAPKYKDLICLAVSAQIPCKYCVHWNTEAAKLNGAVEREIREAIAMASITRLWSTVLNGSMPDEAQFRREVDQVIKHMRRGTKAAQR